MIRKAFLAMFCLLVFSALTLAQDTKPQEAEKILNESLKEAIASNKTVMVIFHASWCGWCKRLEKAFESAELKKILEDNFVYARLDVLERGEKIAALENPGGKEIMKNLGGEKSGLPFLAFLNSEGKLASNSNVMPENQNIGYPGAPEEITAFVKMLKENSKHLTDADVAVLVDYFTKNAPKPKS